MIKKNKRLILKFNKKSYNLLQQRANDEGLNLNACIRKLIAEAVEIDIPPDIEEEWYKVEEIRKLGNDLIKTFRKF